MDMKISLEDFCEDIVGKAMRGTDTSIEALADRSHVSVTAIQALLRGEGDGATARAVAPSLNLDPDKLADSLRERWYPEPRELEGLFMTNTPYHDMRVNAYLVWDAASKEGAIFDTGSDATGLIRQAQRLEIKVSEVFLTHTHKDHIMDLASVRDAFEAVVHVGEREPLPDADLVKHGDRFNIGSLSVTARLTWGHSEGGVTYLVEGLADPLAIVGDAIFAGSMGGGMVSYADALRCNREEILSLPDETILCPGHGPLTTVGEEKQHNPFF